MFDVRSSSVSYLIRLVAFGRRPFYPVDPVDPVQFSFNIDKFVKLRNLVMPAKAGIRIYLKPTAVNVWRKPDHWVMGRYYE